MWRKANEKMNLRIKRIGITKDVIRWLQQNGHPDLTVEDVEEPYSPNENRFIEEDDSYLRTTRIELDSIIEKVGAETFCKYIVHKLETEFPAPRDYRQIVPEPEPEDYYPDKIKKFFEYIEKSTKQAYTPKWEEIKESDLKGVKGLLHVDDKKEEIDEVLRPIVQEEDEGMQKIIEELDKLMESGKLPELKDENDDA